MSPLGCICLSVIGGVVGIVFRGLVALGLDLLRLALVIDLIELGLLDFEWWRLEGIVDDWAKSDFR